MMRAMLSAPGVVGARQAGAGFGGCMVAFVERSLVGEFSASVNKAYLDETGTQPEIYPVKAAAGAGLLTPPGLVEQSQARAPYVKPVSESRQQCVL